MIKVLVYNEPTAIIDASTDIIDFEFENFGYKNCQDFIEICLKQNKTIEIFSINEEEKE